MMRITFAIATKDNTVRFSAVSDRGYRIRVPAVDLCQYGFHFWIAQLVFGVPPIKRAQRFIERIVGLFRFGDQAQSKLMYKPRFGSSIGRRVSRFLAPLQKTLGVSERTFLLRITSDWKKENLRLNF